MRIAWLTAGEEADLEAPLPVDVRQPQDDLLFFQKVNAKLPLELTPVVPLYNRHVREFRKQNKKDA